MAQFKSHMAEGAPIAIAECCRDLNFCGVVRAGGRNLVRPCAPVLPDLPCLPGVLHACLNPTCRQVLAPQLGFGTSVLNRLLKQILQPENVTCGTAWQVANDKPALITRLT